MKRKIKSVGIHKPSGVSMFEMGAYLVKGEDKTSVKVEKITINVFDTVKIDLSDGNQIEFKGFPISIDRGY